MGEKQKWTSRDFAIYRDGLLVAHTGGTISVDGSRGRENNQAQIDNAASIALACDKHRELVEALKSVLSVCIYADAEGPISVADSEADAVVEAKRLLGDLRELAVEGDSKYRRLMEYTLPDRSGGEVHMPEDAAVLSVRFESVLDRVVLQVMERLGSPKIARSFSVREIDEMLTLGEEVGDFVGTTRTVGGTLFVFEVTPATSVTSPGRP